MVNQPLPASLSQVVQVIHAQLVSKPMNNSYDRDGGPVGVSFCEANTWWQAVILERIDQHRVGLNNAQVLEDFGEVDAHAFALEELSYLCDVLGIEEAGK